MPPALNGRKDIMTAKTSSVDTPVGDMVYTQGAGRVWSGAVGCFNLSVLRPTGTGPIKKSSDATIRTSAATVDEGAYSTANS